MQTTRIKTGIWHADRFVELAFPDNAEIKVHWPSTPRPLSSSDLNAVINHPINQEPLHKLAVGKKKPVVIVDDLARPTPVYAVLPRIINQFKEAGVQADKINVVVATGTHGTQNRQALKNKIGASVFSQCNVIDHDDLHGLKYVGKTSFATPVYVNRLVLGSDLLVGVGGLYPQYTCGFGGGSKLALGVLGRKTIRHLHFKHKSGRGAYSVDNDFRKDLDEIARLIRLDTIFTLHINAFGEVVRVFCGDHHSYYKEALAFTLDRYSAPCASDTNVVIANAYPFDLSYTLMRKGYMPLMCASSNAMKVMLASNPEGIGTHGLFQHITPPWHMKYINLYRRVSVQPKKQLLDKLAKHIRKRRMPLDLQRQQTSPVPGEINLLHVFLTDQYVTEVPLIKGMRIKTDWSVIKADMITKCTDKQLRVELYPCAPLQCIQSEHQH